MFLNRDGSDLGSFVQQAVEASIRNHTNAKLGWKIHDPSTYTTDATVLEAVLDQKFWMAVVGVSNETKNRTYESMLILSLFYHSRSVGDAESYHCTRIWGYLI